MASEPEVAADAPDEFPCASFKAAARYLRRPFTEAAVKFKVQATWPKDNPTGGLIVAYIDARLVVERLNLLVPDLWHDEYRAVGQGQMWCDLTIDGITRSDVGEGTGKALVSDSLKRAAVRFGIGVSLYAIPKMMLDAQSGTLKQKRTRDGLTLELTPAGESLLRQSYSHWLDAHGRQAFGDPLDHGDVSGAQGDAEGDDAPPIVEQDTTPAYGYELADESVEKVHEAIRYLLGDLPWAESPESQPIFDAVSEDAGGYFPRIVGRSILRVAAGLKARMEAEPSPDSGGES